MINTIKAILEFDISDDKKVELIRALLKEELKTTSGLAQSLPCYVYTSGTTSVND